MITKTFGYTGGVQVFTTPANVDVNTPLRLGILGARGCPIRVNVDQQGGTTLWPGVYGSYVEGDRTPVAGQALYLSVGGGPVSDIAPGGWNGGAPGSSNGFGPGGGASDVRIGNTDLTSRIAVAAGGPGGSSSGPQGTYTNMLVNPVNTQPYYYDQTPGTTGSSLPDSGRVTNGKGGTQSAGGAPGVYTPSVGSTLTASPGTLGNGGAGSRGGGGGGGGYYGGGGGCGNASDLRSAGGYGSNFIGGLSGVLVNERMLLAFNPDGSIVTNGRITITYNLVPNAPTPTYPSNANFDTTLGCGFRWTFSDDDPTDSQSAFEVRYRTDPAAAWSSSGKITSPDSTWTLPSNTVPAGSTVEWQVRTYDQSNAVSAWSASAFANACNPPATSFVFNPALTGIASREPVVTGNRSDNTPIAQWRFQVVNDASGSPGTTVLADTGIVTAPSGSTSVTQTLPDVAYVNGAKYHVLGMIANPAGVWQHGWTDSGALTVNIQPPPTPTLTAVFDPVAGTVALAWTNPTPSDPALAAVSVDIVRTEGSGDPERIRTGLPVNSGTTDYIPAGSSSGVPVDYRAIAYTATGASASSA